VIILSSWCLVNAVSNDQLLAELEAGTLPQGQWDHEAHVRVCHAALARYGSSEALGVLRQAIRAYNETIGRPNTATGGYHETITRYFVMVVAAAGDVDIATILRSPACDREAPLRHWSKERLCCAEARRAWLEPDLVPLPWAVRRHESGKKR
jgi:hypothetical protein